MKWKKLSSVVIFAFALLSLTASTHGEYILRFNLGRAVNQLYLIVYVTGPAYVCRPLIIL